MIKKQNKSVLGSIRLGNQPKIKTTLERLYFGQSIFWNFLEHCLKNNKILLKQSSRTKKQQKLTKNQPTKPTNQKTNLKYSWLVMVGQKYQPKTNQKTNQPRQKPTFSWLVADPRLTFTFSNSVTLRRTTVYFPVLIGRKLPSRKRFILI